MTVGDIKSRMTYQELMGWQEYKAVNGPLSPHLRIDAAVARGVAPFVSGDKAWLLPWPKEPEREAEPEEVMAVLMTSFKNKGAKRVRP